MTQKLSHNHHSQKTSSTNLNIQNPSNPTPPRFKNTHSLFLQNFSHQHDTLFPSFLNFLASPFKATSPFFLPKKFPNPQNPLSLPIPKHPLIKILILFILLIIINSILIPASSTTFQSL